MSSNVMFVTSTIVTCLLILIFIFKFNIKEMILYFKTDDGKGILKGILLAIIFGILLVIFFHSEAEENGEWFAYGEVYLGLDKTFDHTAECWGDGPADKVTSNLGVKANVYRSFDRRFESNIKYTHHSCAVNRDNYPYDAVGIEFTYKLWGN